DVAAGAYRPAAAASQKDREVVVVVRIAVAQAGTVDDHAVVEQRAVALAHRLELVEEVGELPRVERVDLRELFDVRLVAEVVRDVVVALVDAEERVRAVGALVADDEGADAR